MGIYLCRAAMPCLGRPSGPRFYWDSAGDGGFFFVVIDDDANTA